MGEIYLVTNNLNNIHYIGKTIYTARERWNQHVRHAKSKNSLKYHIHNAINKYGEENFSINIFKSKKVKSEKELFEDEKFFIKTFKENGVKLYNLSDGGEGPSGFRHSEEVKKTISLKSKEVWANTEYKEGHSNTVLTRQQALCVKNLYEERKKPKEISDELGISISSVYHILLGKHWSNETGIKKRDSIFPDIKISKQKRNLKNNPFNEEEKINIRNLYFNQRISYRKIALIFGVSPPTIGKLINSAN